MDDEDAMLKISETDETKMTNRRRMAWLSIGGVIGFGIAAILVPDRVSKVDTVIISVIGALIGVVLVYMGSAAMVNWKGGK